MKPLLIVVTALSLLGCSTLKRDGAPGCHGARRPANPHGSVLAPADPAATTPSPAAGHGGCAGGEA